jgi:hypothetical protein
VSNMSNSTSRPAVRSAAYTLFSTPQDQVGPAKGSPQGTQLRTLSNPTSPQPNAGGTEEPVTVAAGAAFRVSPSGQITDVRFQLQTHGISPELAARLIARLAAGQQSRGIRATADGPDSLLPAPASAEQQARVRIFHDIEATYQETRSKVVDSPIVTDFCLRALRQARLLSLSGTALKDLETAASYIEIVRAKIARSTAVRRDDSGQIDAIVAWTFASFLIALPLAVLPWLAPSGNVGSIRIAPDFLPLLAALGWGTIGGVAATLYHLPWFVQLREYDSAYYLEYLARPPKGFMIGGALFIALYLGASVLNLAMFPAGGRIDSPLVFLAALVAGFRQEQVWKLIVAAVRKTPLASPSSS